MEAKETKLGPPVVDLLGRKLGHPLVLSATKSVPYSAKLEFSILSASTQRVRRADVTAARWNFDGTPLTVAVECKATVAAVFDALGQAAEYQSFFDEVYIATPLNLDALGLVRSTLVELGIGHITVDTDRQIAEVTVSPVPRWPSRFQPHRRSVVDIPLGVGLAFLNVRDQGLLRSGVWGSKNLGVWYAEEVQGHRQWNAWALLGEGQHDVGAGLNVEHIQDVREIVAHVDVDRLQGSLTACPPDIRLRVEYCPNPRPSGADNTIVIDLPASEANAKTVFDALGSHPSRMRPQLSVSRRLTSEQTQVIRRGGWEEFLSGVRDDIAPVMELLL